MSEQVSWKYKFFFFLKPTIFRIDGEDFTYDARIYKVADDWTLTIERKQGNKPRVFRIYDDGESEELIQCDVKTYKTNDSEMTISEFCEMIKKIVVKAPWGIVVTFLKSHCTVM